MKKNYIFLLSLSLLLVLSSCAVSEKEKIIDSTEGAKEDVVETTAKVIPILETVNKMSEEQINYDSKNTFTYTGDNEYLKVICDEMVNRAKDFYASEEENIVNVPAPLVVKTDDSDKNDIKVWGDFWSYGYAPDGSIFVMKNGGSYPGCYHLKEEDGNVSFVRFDVAEDGARNWDSLVEICEGDENLAKEIYAIPDKDNDKTRAEFIKMYARDNGLNISGYKDFGWPVVLFPEIHDAEFAYNFYKFYMDEVREEDYLNNLQERLTNLKEKYMTTSLIKELDDRTKDLGADAVISAQDVIDLMFESLYADDYGKGEVVVHFEKSSADDDVVSARLKIKNDGGKKVIESITIE